MKNLALFTILILGTQTNFAQAQSIALAKAAELSVHRVERLVTLKKIEEAFMSKFSGVVIEALKQAKPTDPAFKAIASQVPGPDGKQSKVEILMDGAGKALSHNVVSGTEATVAPRWPEKDPVTLSENAMHVVLDGKSDPKLKPYFDGFKSIEISQDRDSTGQTIARGKMKAVGVAKTLEVVLKMDGTVISSQLID